MFLVVGVSKKFIKWRRRQFSKWQFLILTGRTASIKVGWEDLMIGEPHINILFFTIYKLLRGLIVATLLYLRKVQNLPFLTVNLWHSSSEAHSLMAFKNAMIEEIKLHRMRYSFEFVYIHRNNLFFGVLAQ